MYKTVPAILLLINLHLVIGTETNESGKEQAGRIIFIKSKYLCDLFSYCNYLGYDETNLYWASPFPRRGADGKLVYTISSLPRSQIKRRN